MYETLYMYNSIYKMIQLSFVINQFYDQFLTNIVILINVLRLFRYLFVHKVWYYILLAATNENL